jgi:hypothetical protein
MGYTSIFENLAILFFLAPVAILTWWGIVRLVNRSMGYDLKKIYDQIYKDPVASAILRVGVMFTIAYMVGQAFNRIV